MFKSNPKISYYSPVFLFILLRLVLYLSLPLEGLRGYGDFVHFYSMAGMGWPFINYWVEFPPIFPFLSTILYHLAGGLEHVYNYLLAFSLIACDGLSLMVFLRLVYRLNDEVEAAPRVWVYFALLAGLAYSWWYFDALVVLALLLSLEYLLKGHDIRLGLVMAAGTLTKFFPIMGLIVVWRQRSFRRAILTTILTLGLTLVVWFGLYALSPKMTLASLRSQANKGSWETVWALIDGNLHTGNFGADIERFDASTAALPRGNPPRIPSWLTFIGFAGIGAYFFFKAGRLNERAGVTFLGFAWCLFLLWSPGYSPQWVLYLLPLILLVLPIQRGVLLTISLVLVNLLEWPLLLSRGLFWSLWIVVPVRTILIILLTVEFWKTVKSNNKNYWLHPS